MGIQFKGCTRCQGALKRASDHYGEYILCLQCGHMVYIEEPHISSRFERGIVKLGRVKKNGRWFEAA